jgi:hypothetical protein
MNHTSEPLDCFVIRANSELQHELQLKYDDIILLSHKLLLSRLSPRHIFFFERGYGGLTPA